MNEYLIDWGMAAGLFALVAGPFVKGARISPTVKTWLIWGAWLLFFTGLVVSALYFVDHPPVTAPMEGQ